MSIDVERRWEYVQKQWWYPGVEEAVKANLEQGIDEKKSVSECERAMIRYCNQYNMPKAQKRRVVSEAMFATRQLYKRSVQ